MVTKHAIQLNLRPRLGSGLMAWAIAWAAVAAIGWTLVQADRAVEPLSLAAKPHQLAIGDDAAVLNGVEFRIVSSETNVAESTVVVAVVGRPELGSSIALSDIAFLENAEGERVYETGGRAEGRTLKLSFPGASDLPTGSLRLHMRGIALGEPTVSMPPAGMQTPPTLGDVSLLAEPKLAAGPLTHRMLNAVGGEDPGPRIIVEEIVSDARQAVVKGRLVGVKPEDVPRMDLSESLLLRTGGERVRLAGRVGFGERSDQFALKLDRVPAAGDTVRLVLNVRHSDKVEPGGSVTHALTLDVTVGEAE